ncbi:hypothetical protein DIPPA_22880 [Diplonema papillatum]|nr:hypothetical protein DIPPA_22880 [Diplonema papillatum]
MPAAASSDLVTGNRAKFLRKMLRIAGEKKETWWYVKDIIENARGLEVLTESATRDEVRHYQAVSRRPEACRRSAAPPAAPAAIQDDDSGGESSDFEARAAEFLRSKKTEPRPRRRPQTASPGAACFAGSFAQEPSRRQLKYRPLTAPMRRPARARAAAQPRRQRPASAARRASLLFPPQPARATAATVFDGTSFGVSAAPALRPAAAAQYAGADPEDRPVSACWDQTNGAVSKVQAIIATVDACFAEERAADEAVSPAEVAYALQDVGSVDGSDRASEASAASSARGGVGGGGGGGVARDNGKPVGARRGRKLPAGVRAQQPRGDSPPLVMRTRALPGGAGEGAPAPEPAAAYELSRHASLNGASNVFKDGTRAADRAARWGPCVASIAGIEEAAERLEAFWTRKRGGGELEHLPAVAPGDVDAALAAGMDDEAETMAALLRRWAADIEQRVRVLVLYENTAYQAKTYAREDRGSQTLGGVNPPDGGDTKNPTKDEPPSDPSEGGRGGSTEEEAGSPFSSVGKGKRAGAARGNPSFERVAARCCAALRVQSCWRGCADRRVVGNFRTSTVTFFHAADPRVRNAWRRCARRAAETAEPAPWLLRFASSYFAAKIASDYLSGPGEAPDATDFLFAHLHSTLDSSTSAATALEKLLATLHTQLSADLLNGILTNLLLGTWDGPYGRLLSRVMCCVPAVKSRAAAPNLIDPPLALDVDIPLSQAQVRSVVRMAYGNPRAAGGQQPREPVSAVVDAVIKKCRAMAHRGPSDGAGDAKDCPVVVTQKELYYAALVTATPDVLTAYGF